MSTPISIAFDAEASTATRTAIHTAVASLPESFTTRGGGQDVLVVDGTNTSWATKTRRASGAHRAVLVVDPGPTDTEELHALGDSEGVVLLDAPWRHNDVLPRISATFAGNAQEGALLEGRCTVGAGDALDQAVIDLAFTAAALLPTSVPVLQNIISSTSQRLFTAIASEGLNITLSAVVGVHDVGWASFRLVTAEQTLNLTLPPSPSGQPSVAAITTVNGKTVLPYALESTHRSALRRLREALNGASSVNDLPDFISAVGVQNRATDHT